MAGLEHSIRKMLSEEKTTSKEVVSALSRILGKPSKVEEFKTSVNFFSRFDGIDYADIKKISKLYTLDAVGAEKNKVVVTVSF